MTGARGPYNLGSSATLVLYNLDMFHPFQQSNSLQTLETPYATRFVTTHKQ